ncbi:MAG: hypothetical protein RL689_959 [Planctomycetota bacterium]|jgi:hypothetical protein
MVERRMDLQRVMMKGMLWLLAAAAVTGCFAILTAAANIAWRTSGTFLAGAIGMAMSVVAARSVPSPGTRAAGLTGMALTLVSFLMAVLSIWWDRLPLVQPTFVAMVWGTTIATAGASIVVHAAMLLCSLDGHRTAGRAAVACCIVEWTLTLLVIWADQLHLDRERWFNLATSMAWPIIVAVSCLVNLDARDGRHWRWIGVAAAVIGAIMVVMRMDVDMLEEWNVTLAVTGVFLAYANCLMLVPLARDGEWIRRGTIGSAFATATLIILATWIGWSSWSVIELGRLVGASSIVTACGTIALAVLRGLQVRSSGLVDVPIRELDLACPRCSHHQRLKTGGDDCDQCGLRIHVVLKARACQGCGYPRDGLKHAVCPECGMAWTPTGAPATPQGA